MRFIAVIGALGLLGACATQEPGPPGPQSLPPVSLPTPPAATVRAAVLRVSDGDTVVLSGIEVGRAHRGGGRDARLIGVDTPEVTGRAECFGREASAFTTRVLDGAQVRVGFDVGREDRYGRALVYLWTSDGSLFNARLVAEGYATPATVPPNVRYASLFVSLSRSARERRAGLWGEGCA